MAIKCTICVILMIKLFLTEFCGKNEKGTKSGTAAIHSRFLQEETMSKTSRCSTVQCRSEPSHQRGKQASKLAALNLATGQSQPVKTTSSHLQYLQKTDRHTRAHKGTDMCSGSPEQHIDSSRAPCDRPGLPPITAPVHTHTMHKQSVS